MLEGQQLLADLTNLAVAVPWGIAYGVACQLADFLEVVQLMAALSVGWTGFLQAAVRMVAVAAAASDARFAL